MNILILSWRGPGHPEAGGAEISAHEHAKAWVKAGHGVTLFTSYFKGGSKDQVIDGIRIIRRGGDVFGVQFQALVWYLLGEHSKFDLVVDQFHGIPFFSPLYVRTKKLAFIHEVAKEVWWFNPWPKPFNLIPAVIGTIFERFMFMILYKKIPFMTVSESTQKDLMIWGIPSKNITVIHNGVSTVKVKVKKEKKNTLIYLGAITKDKGIEDAIETFSLINRKDPNWQFWVVGKGESNYVKSLQGKVQKFDLTNKIVFWGFVDQKKKFELLRKAHILINPSAREGWGLVNIEANSVGTPVVGYNVAGMRDSVKDGATGFLVIYGHYRELSDCVIELCKTPHDYEKIRTNALKWSRKFSWENSCMRSINLINRICKK